MSKFVRNDGGREAAGYKGVAGDCVVRAIALATGRKYKTVYGWMKRDQHAWYKSQGCTGQRLTRLSSPTYRGITSGHYEPYLGEAGWYRDRPFNAETWCVGDTVADVANRFRKETVVVQSRRNRRGSSHLCCIKRGVLLDTWDCRESEVTAVYRKR